MNLTFHKGTAKMVDYECELCLNEDVNHRICSSFSMGIFPIQLLTPKVFQTTYLFDLFITCFYEKRIPKKKRIKQDSFPARRDWLKMFVKFRSKYTSIFTR